MNSRYTRKCCNQMKCRDTYGVIYIRKCLLSSHHHHKFYDSQSGSYITKPGSLGIRYHDNYLRYKVYEKSSSNDTLNDNYVVKYILSLVDNNKADNNSIDDINFDNKDEIKSYSMSYYNKTTLDFNLFMQKSLSYLHRNHHRIPLKLSILIDDTRQLYDIQAILMQSSSSSSSSSSISSSLKITHDKSYKSISNNISNPDKDRIINDLLEVEFDFILDKCYDNVNISVDGGDNEDHLSLMNSFSSILRQYHINSRVNIFINIDHCIHHHHDDVKAHVDTIAIGRTIGNICDLGLNIINLTLFYSNSKDQQYILSPTITASSTITADTITSIDSNFNNNNNDNGNNNDNKSMNNKLMYLNKDKVIDYVREIIEECLFLDVVGDPLIERLSIQLSSQLPELRNLAQTYGITRYSICKGSTGDIHYVPCTRNDHQHHHRNNSILHII